MNISGTICKNLNKVFIKPVHPFNLAQEKQIDYCQWQYDRADLSIKNYIEKVSSDIIFKDKIVIDIGCGAAGKSIYYATLGAKKVYGVEILDKYRQQAEEFAKKMKVNDIFEFISGNAENLNFEMCSIDTIIMNDSMEHVDNPMVVINECFRVLKEGGRLYVNFPPYYHPFGAHLSDIIGIPWVHIFFDDDTLIDVYKDLVHKYSDYKERIDFRISKRESGKEFFSYINKMTIKKYKDILRKSKMDVIYYKEKPLRNIVSVLTKIPFIKEFFVGSVVTIFEKSCNDNQ